MAVDRKVNSGGKVGKAEQLKSRDKSPRFALLKRCSVHTSWVKSEGRLQAITTSHRSSLLPTTLSKQEHVQGAYTFQPQEVQHVRSKYILSPNNKGTITRLAEPCEQLRRVRRSTKA